MTIEEARKIIKQFRDRQGNSSDDIEAFDLVIKALEQQPNDCISREDVKEQMLKYGFNAPDMTVTEFVEDLPSAIPSYNSIKTELKPCEDCISRERLLARIDAERKHLLDLKMDGAEHIVVHHARRIIEDMPSVTTKAEWISCSERLPKENEYIGDVYKYYLIQDEYGDMHVAHLSNVGWIPMKSLKAIGDEIIAWMPLPELYNAESNKESDAE